MKSLIAIVWLLMLLLPALGKAEEPVATPAGGPPSQYSSLEGEHYWCDPLLSEVKARDEELLQIVGHGLDPLSSLVAGFPGKIEMAGSKIKLWDEADRGINKFDLSIGREIYQKITLSAISGNR